MSMTPATDLITDHIKTGSRAIVSHLATVTSTIPSHLIANYLNTDYQISIPNELICLRINHYSKPLAQMLQTTQQTCGAIISAYNPQSRLRSDRENAQAHQWLKHVLSEQGYAIAESVHSDPAGKWPIEKGFLVTGINVENARSIGQQFGQNAIVWTGSDAIPRLVLLN